MDLDEVLDELSRGRSGGPVNERILVVDDTPANGSLRRTKYTAVGSNVNLAGRVESFSTGGQVLITEETRTRIEAPLRIDGQFQVEPKGGSGSLLLLEIGGIGQPFALSLPSRSTPLRALAEPLAVRFTALQEKFLGHSVHDGHLTELSDFEARVSSSHVPAVLSNLKITARTGSRVARRPA
jgi:adenylate cyclase